MKTNELKVLLSSLAVAGFLAGCASTPAQDSSSAQDTQRVAATQAYALLNEPGVAYGHFDLWNRKQGIASYDKGDKTHALFLFKQAALYGDKPAQAMVASMYWSGDGVTRDRPLAYAWMDLAADRGYPELLAQREIYWKGLSSRDRQHALTVGKKVYAKYGDTQAAQRVSRNLGKLRKNITGSRAGYVGNVEVTVLAAGLAPGVYSGTRSDGATFFAPSLTSAAAYMNLKDKAWDAPNYYPGTVTVEPLQRVHDNSAVPNDKHQR